MNGQALIALGLAIDLLGVVLLGVDLIRIQFGLRAEARDRLASFRALVEGNATFQEHVKWVAAQGDWREHQHEEGRMVPYGGFDYSAASSSFKDATDLAASVRDDLTELTQHLADVTQGDQRRAETSLVFSYSGILLIMIGFGIQIWGQFIN